MFFILVFFPFVPAIIYSQVLWVWGIKNISIHSLEKRENLARQIRGNFVFVLTFRIFYLFLGISGGFEAGLQLTFTIWLILKKVISVKNFLNVTWKKGSYGNFFPSIPLISATSSFLTMLTTCIRLVNTYSSISYHLFRLNLPLPYEAYNKKDFLGRYREQSLQILECFPYFVFSSLFRVSCLAFMWIYLAFYATIPILVLLLVNILIFYILESDKGKFIDMKIFNFPSFCSTPLSRNTTELKKFFQRLST